MATAVDLILEFDSTLDDAVGLYLDAQQAMIEFAKTQDNNQDFIAAKLNITVAHLDKQPLIYGHGDPNDRTSLALHSTTNGEWRRRNARGGKNHLLLGQRFIVDIYTYWEDGYRSAIAESLNKSRGEIKSDVLGDIRLLRNSIIHHLGIAKPDVNECKILTWFRVGDVIDISDDTRFHFIIVEIRKWLEAFATEATGSSPGLLARYAPTGHKMI